MEAAPVQGLPPAEPKPIFAATRLGGVSVLAPYDQQAFTVKRADGSVAFDPANRFAAAFCLASGIPFIVVRIAVSAP